MKYEKLLKEAKKAKENAYAPYSGFRVGAALLGKSGRVYTGANVENAAYSVTCCAERVALFKAVSGGERDFDAIAVTSDSDAIIAPCGVCRQALMEFSPHMDVVTSNKNLDCETETLDQLLPKAFTGKEMETKSGS
ncbi:MAG: cytidine deaminase [Eubacteriales bacterium]|nr:cytidine deaminase [Eubacteriales bacterium]